jgi:FixJ family two-component response regulator
LRQIKADGSRPRQCRRHAPLDSTVLKTPQRDERPIVLVDDDPALLQALAFAFETDGYCVASYANGEALLASLPPATGCFVVDQNLPGLAGLDLIERLRANGERAPAVLITSRATRIMRARAANAQVEIVEKPLMGDILGRRVQHLIALH